MENDLQLRGSYESSSPCRDKVKERREGVENSELVCRVRCVNKVGCFKAYDV